MRCLGIGCVVLFIIAIVTGAIVYINAGKWTRQGIGHVTELAAESVIASFNLPPEEAAAAMKPIRAFVLDIKDGNVTMEQGAEVMKALMQGPAFAILMARAFEVQFVEASDLADQQKADAHVSISRFMAGLTQNKIPAEKANDLMEIISIEQVDQQGNTQRVLKQELSEDEVNEALALMRDAADGASIPLQAQTIDLGTIIQDAIDAGMQTGGTPGAAAVDTPPPPRPRRPRPGEATDTTPDTPGEEPAE